MEKGQGSELEMARRKTVREESRREVGTLDMAYYSTLSLLLDDDSIGMCLPCCDGGRERALRCQERGREGRQGARVL